MTKQEFTNFSSMSSRQMIHVLVNFFGVGFTLINILMFITNILKMYFSSLRKHIFTPNSKKCIV